MKFRLHIFCGSICVLLFFASCSSTRYLPQGKYLLSKTSVEVTEKKKDVNEATIRPYIRQQENTRSLFGMKIPLGIYNASPRCDSCWFGKLLKKMGEAPVVFDSKAVTTSSQNIEMYLNSQGYYYAKVKDRITYSGHKARVTYTITPGEVFSIQDVKYQLEDTLLGSFILKDTVNSLLKQGQTLSINLLSKESERLETFLHTNGFYTFNRNLISYTADTTKGGRKADLTVLLFQNEQPEEVDSLQYNKRFRIRNVKIYADYNATEAYSDTSYLSGYSEFVAQQLVDTGNIAIYYRDKRIIRPNVLLRANTIQPGQYYSETERVNTYNNLSNLRLYQAVAIRYDKATDTDDETLVDCIIRLTPSALQNYNIKMEASISNLGLLGLSPNVSYNHRNLFKGAEQLNISLSDNYQFDPFNITNSQKRSNELAASVNLSIPKLFFPFFTSYFRNYAPRTEFSTNYGFQLRPEYTRNSLSFQLGYNWRTTPHLTYIVNPLNLNIVKLYNMSTDFYNSIANDPYLRNRYEDHFVLGANASFIYSTRQPANTSNSMLLRWNLGIAGNILSLFNNTMSTNSSGNHLLWGTPYSQYAKTDVNFSYYWVLNKKQTLAYRLFAGVGRAYGNSISLPYEEVYYSGGAYSLRGWQSRSVGPGAAPMDTTFSIPNQVGDFKLEANVEYRFNLTGVFDGALFLDAGNIWSLNYGEADELAVLRSSTFFKQIALNTGFGLRLNLGFTVICIDVGVRLYEPRLYSGWVAGRNILAIDNMSLHLGIGYPF